MDAAIGLDKGKEEERKNGQEEKPGNHLHSWCPESKDSFQEGQEGRVGLGGEGGGRNGAVEAKAG